MSLTVQRITRGRDFADLRPVWSALTAEAGVTSPFLGFEWIWSCWHAVWPHRRPEVLLFEQGPRPVAIMPLMWWKDSHHHLPVRHLGFLRYLGRPAFDIITVLGHGPVIEALLTHLASRSDWDLFHVRQLPPSSATLDAFDHALSGRLPAHRAARYFSLSLHLGRDDVDFKPRPAGIRAEGDTHAACGVNRVSLEKHTVVDPDSAVLREVDTALRYPGNDPGTLTSASRLLHFMRELVRRSGDQYDVRLWLLRRNGRLAAAESQLWSRGHVHTLCVDANGTSHLLPTLTQGIVAALVEDTAVSEYDMGLGLAEHKLCWSPDVREWIDLSIYREHAYARMLYALETSVLPALQRWRRTAAPDAAIAVPPGIRTASAGPAC